MHEDSAAFHLTLQATVSAAVERKDVELAALRKQLEEAQAAAEVGAPAVLAGVALLAGFHGSRGCQCL